MAKHKRNLDARRLKWILIANAIICVVSGQQHEDSDFDSSTGLYICDIDSQPVFHDCSRAEANLVFVLAVSPETRHAAKETMIEILYHFDVGNRVHVVIGMVVDEQIVFLSYPGDHRARSEILDTINRLDTFGSNAHERLLPVIRQIDSTIDASSNTERKTIVIYLWEKLINEDLSSLPGVLLSKIHNRDMQVFLAGATSESLQCPDVYNSTQDSPPLHVITVQSPKHLLRLAHAVTHALCPVCDPDWVFHDSSCYQMIVPTENVTERTARGWSGVKWLTAKTLCSLVNGNLVSVNSVEEAAFLELTFIEDLRTNYTQMFGSSQAAYVHIGLKRTGKRSLQLYGGTFHWSSGEPMVFVRWDNTTMCSNSTQPDGAKLEECVAWKITLNSLCGWHDIGCGDPIGNAFICERPAHNLKIHYGAPRLLNATSVFDNSSVMASTFRCTNGEFISLSLVCDKTNDCYDGSDELSCDDDCEWNQFKCANRRCISMNFYCDFKDDCGDNSDEKECARETCPNAMFECDSGQCIPPSARCDLRDDCIDKSDETDCDHCNGFWCFDGTCIPRDWTCDGWVDCAGRIINEDENTELACPEGSPFDRLQTSEYRCHLIPDGYGRFLGPRDMTHLRNCENHTCQDEFFRCSRTDYCIAPELVCNGVQDCPRPTDETDCAAFTCPGYFRCSHTTTCLRMDSICDGVKNCPNGDDELYCDHADHCPPNCSCTGQVVDCRDVVFDANWTGFHRQTRQLDLSGTRLNLLPQSYFENLKSHLNFLGSLNLSNTELKMVPRFPKMANLYDLDLSFNNITELVNRTFANLTNLKYLTISNNPFLERIAKYSFVHLNKLQSLDLSNTALRNLKTKMFENLHNLLFLNLSNSHIISVQDNTFYNLHKLKVLDITNNPIELFHSNMFSGLTSIGELHSPSFKFCCSALWAGHVWDSDDCFAVEDTISSCENLMQRGILRLFMWILGIGALMGNTVVIAYQIFFIRREIGRTYSVFVTNLGVSDFCMGVYMLIISSVDVKYRGTYLWHELEWRHSPLCKMAGFLATLSSEASIVFVCLITIDRFLVIRFPFGQIRFRRHSAITTAIIVWIAVIIIASIPLLPPLDQWVLYSQNGVCLALPLSVERRPGWEFSTTIFIGFNFLAFLFIAVGQVAIYRSMMNTSVLRDKIRAAQEMQVARRLSLIVLTDFCCWFPVCLMGLLALSGTEIGAEVYAWTAVFILPVNSALNPFLYTVPSLLHRKERYENAKSCQFSPVMRLSRIRRNSLTPRVKFVYVGEPQPKMKPLSDMIKQRMLVPDHIHWLCGHIMASLPSLNIQSAENKHVKIYIKMSGNVPSRVCICLVDGERTDHEEGIEYGVGALLNKLQHACNGVPSNTDAI